MPLLTKDEIKEVESITDQPIIKPKQPVIDLDDLLQDDKHHVTWNGHLLTNEQKRIFEKIVYFVIDPETKDSDIYRELYELSLYKGGDTNGREET